MHAKSVGINCIIVKTIVHLNTVCLNIKKLSTFYQEILVLTVALLGINVTVTTGIFSACGI